MSEHIVSLLHPPTPTEYTVMCQQTQAKLATLDFADAADYKEGMNALAELNLQGALLKRAELEQELATCNTSRS